MSRISPEDVVNNTHVDNFKIPQRPSNRPPVRKISIHPIQDNLSNTSLIRTLHFIAGKATTS